MTELEKLRGDIDRIDNELVILLAQRFQITRDIGQLKFALGLQSVDPDREVRQEQRLSQVARCHGLSESIAINIFRAIINEVVLNHETIMRQRRETDSL